MRFQRKKQVYSVVRITGPQHNLLQFKVPRPGQVGHAEPPVRELEPPKQCEPLLDRDQVRRHVHAGLARARSELGHLPEIIEIGFVVSDTQPEAIYDELAFALACHISRDSSSLSSPSAGSEEG